MSKQDNKLVLLKKLSNIEPLPAIITQLTELMEQDEPDINSIAKVLKTEIGLTTRLLRVANSPFFGFQRQVSSINEAIVMLGLTDLKNLVMSFVIVRQFDKVGIWDILDQERFWQHSMAVAGLGARLATLVGRGELKNDAFTLGVIHRLGMCVLAHSFPTEYKAALSKEAVLEHNEITTLGLDHHEVGALICQHWNLPVRFVTAVALSKSESEAEMPEKTALLTTILGLSIQLIPLLGYGSPRFVPLLDIEADLASLGISGQQFSTVWAGLSRELSLLTSVHSAKEEVLSGINIALSPLLLEADATVSFELFRLGLGEGVSEGQSGSARHYVLYDGDDESVDGEAGKRYFDIAPFTTFFEGQQAINWVGLRQALLIEIQVNE